MSADAPILYDWSGAPVSTSNAPVTGRPATALNTTAQGGIVALGSDYGTTAKAQAPKIDAYGTVSVTATNPAGGNAYVYTGQTPPAAASQFGMTLYGRQDLPTPSVYAPALMDQTGALQTHNKSKVTFVSVAKSVALGTNVILQAIYNGGSMVLRLQYCCIYIPPAGGVGAALLGQSSGLNYYPVRCEVRRITTYTGGTSLSLVPLDSADSLSTGMTAATSVTSVASTVATLHRADAYATNTTGMPFYNRGDPNAKTIVIRPGEGIAFVCTDSGTVNSTTAGGGTLTGSCDIETIITQAAA